MIGNEQSSFCLSTGNSAELSKHEWKSLSLIPLPFKPEVRNENGRGSTFKKEKLYDNLHLHRKSFETNHAVKQHRKEMPVSRDCLQTSLLKDNQLFERFLFGNSIPMTVNEFALISPNFQFAPTQVLSSSKSPGKCAR